MSNLVNTVQIIHFTGEQSTITVIVTSDNQPLYYRLHKEIFYTVGTSGTMFPHDNVYCACYSVDADLGKRVEDWIKAGDFPFLSLIQ